MASQLNMTQSAVSHQMNVLKSQHIVGSRRDGKQVYYYMKNEPMMSLLHHADFQQVVQDVAEQDVNCME